MESIFTENYWSDINRALLFLVTDAKKKKFNEYADGPNFLCAQALPVELGIIVVLAGKRDKTKKDGIAYRVNYYIDSDQIRILFVLIFLMSL